MNLSTGGLRPSCNGPGKRMLAALLDGKRKTGKATLVHAVDAHDIGDHGFTRCDGSRLVEHNRFDIMGDLERLGRLHQDAAGSPATRSHHNGSWRGQAERAGAADHEHGDGMRERRGHIDGEHHPHEERRNRDDDDDGDEHAGDLVRYLLDGGLSGCGLVDKADDARERGVGADAVRPHDEPPGLVQGSACDGIAGMLADRHALAGDDRFVHHAVAFDDDTVDGHALTGLDHEHVADAHLLDRHLFNAAIRCAPRGLLRRQIHEFGDGVGGLALRPRLEVLAERDERQNHGCGFEAQVHGSRMREIDIPMAHAPADAVDGGDAIYRRCGGTERDERIHVRRAMSKRFKAHAEELEVHEDDRQQQKELGEREREHVLVAQEHPGQGPAEHMPHRQIEQWDGEAEAHDEAHAHSFCLGGGIVHRAHRLLHVVCRGPRLRPRICPIARFLDRCRDCGESGDFTIEIRFHAVLQQVDRYRGDARHVRSGFLDTRRARGARHARHVECTFHSYSSFSAYRANFLMSCMASSMICVLPCSICSTTQVSRWFCNKMAEMLCTALSAAESCTSTSPQ